MFMAREATTALKLVRQPRASYASLMHTGGTPHGSPLARLQARKQAGGKFSALTCYDAPTATIMQQAGVDVLLVGDTAGEVVLGLSSTRDVSPQYMLEITAAVRRGAPTGCVMADLPYACRIGTEDQTVEWCRRFMLETGCDAVKIEVTADDLALVGRIVAAGVPVVPHLGLRPQAVTSPSGYRIQARDAAAAHALIAACESMQQAGACMLLLEAVASEVAGFITRQSPVPVIGCLSGPLCDATVVVLHDMLGVSVGHPPSARTQYLELQTLLLDAFRRYHEDVRAGRFPHVADAPAMRPGEWDRLRALLGERA